MTKTWIVTLDGEKHVVELEHGYWSGKRVIKLDGQKVDESRKWFDTGTEHRFKINEHQCILRILYRTLHYDYELYVDGHLV